VCSFLAKLRLSAHSLAIEIGRYCKPTIPANERFCKACKEKVEDGHHFLIECPIYNSVRDKFFTLFNRKFKKECTYLLILNVRYFCSSKVARILLKNLSFPVSLFLIHVCINWFISLSG
jgi:hypothetical protein